jgi:hypothetical protein
VNSSQQWVIADTTSPTISSQNLVIGSGQYTPSFSENFVGNIACIKIYNRALSANEIAQNYNAQKSRFSL